MVCRLAIGATLTLILILFAAAGAAAEEMDTMAMDVCRMSIKITDLSLELMVPPDLSNDAPGRCRPERMERNRRAMRVNLAEAHDQWALVEQDLTLYGRVKDELEEAVLEDAEAFAKLAGTYAEFWTDCGRPARADLIEALGTVRDKSLGLCGGEISADSVDRTVIALDQLRVVRRDWVVTASADDGVQSRGRGRVRGVVLPEAREMQADAADFSARAEEIQSRVRGNPYGRAGRPWSVVVGSSEGLNALSRALVNAGRRLEENTRALERDVLAVAGQTEAEPISGPKRAYLNRPCFLGAADW